MKVLVTGSAGFIASRLAVRLLERGDHVVGLDNFSDYYPLEHKRRNLADLISQSTFTFIEGDLRNADLLLNLCQQYQPDAIAHIGAMASVRYSVTNPLIYAAVNVQGTLNLLEAARQIGTPHCLLASTGSVYGQSTPAPFAETAAADRPLAPYPASKRAMELFAHSHHHLWNLPVTILRFFNVYGPHGRPDMMPWHWSRQITAGEELTLFASGHLKRDWTYIDDILDGFIAALDSPRGYRVYNLGCGNPVENLDFVHTLAEILGKEAKIRNVPAPVSEPPITYADISKARHELGYTPKVQVREGLRRFVQWMRKMDLL
ncbi:MAG: NAD-dependent epimerase/dehydratase family protein [Phycisphaerae bacterium]